MNTIDPSLLGTGVTYRAIPVSESFRIQCAECVWLPQLVQRVFGNIPITEQQAAGCWETLLIPMLWLIGWQPTGELGIPSWTSEELADRAERFVDNVPELVTWIQARVHDLEFSYALQEDVTYAVVVVILFLEDTGWLTMQQSLAVH